MSSFSSRFVRDKFSEYYKNQSSTILPPSSIEKREFGFLLFDDRIMLRHKSFKTANALQSFLSSTALIDVYYSCAYYEDPEAEMDKKSWLGADLVFDIDADHIPTDCNKIHDEWICNNCGFAGKGIAPEKCPVCAGQKFKVSTWSCEICLESAKTETLKLLDMLMADFGFHEKEIRLFFSGHRGYHVHVEDESIKMLDSIARREIVDYVCGLGVDTTLEGFSKQKSWRSVNIPRDLGTKNHGWQGRIARGLYNFFLNADKEVYEKIGLKPNIAEIITRNKDILLGNLEKGKQVDVVKGLGSKNWKRIIEFCASHQATKVDTVVTTDTHRLIRLADTLHGKTGFKKVEFSIANAESFDPFKSAVAFKNGHVSVLISDAPEFRLGDEIFGPYKNRRVELPTAAAVLLVCKDKAEVIE